MLSSCSVSVKCYLFETYCCILHCALMINFKNKLKVAYMYNNSLRRFMRLQWHARASEIFVNLSIFFVDEMLRIVTFRFMSRAIVLNNVHI